MTDEAIIPLLAEAKKLAQRYRQLTGKKLVPSLGAAIAAGTLTGERDGGCWVEVGTPQRLQEIDESLLVLHNNR